MMWLEMIVGWIFGSVLLAALAGKLMAGMSRVTGDTHGRRAVTVGRRRLVEPMAKAEQAA